MNKPEYMPLDQFSPRSGINYHELMRLANEEKLIKLKIIQGNKYVRITKYTKNLLSQNGYEYDEKPFEKVMHNGVTYYGFLGKICQLERWYEQLL